MHADLVLATRSPKQVDLLTRESQAHTTELTHEYYRAESAARSIDEAYFGSTEGLSGAAATAANERLRAAIDTGDAPSASDLNALVGYDATIASRRFMETTSDSENYLAEIEDADARARDINEAITSERDIRLALAEINRGAKRLRTIGAVGSVLIAAESIYVLRSTAEWRAQEAATVTKEDVPFYLEASVPESAGLLGLSVALLAASVALKARHYPHWRARRRVRKAGASDIIDF